MAGKGTTKVFDFLKREKNIKYIVGIGIAAIAIIFFSEILPKESKSKQANVTEQKNSDNSSQYVEYLEGKLHKIVSSIKDVGEVEVMVTLESSKEKVYAQQEKKNSDITESEGDSTGTKKQQKDVQESSAIVVDGGSGNGKQALVEKELEPKVQGVVIVCQGGDNPLVQMRINEAVTTALEISSERVCITVKQ